MSRTLVAAIKDYENEIVEILFKKGIKPEGMYRDSVGNNEPYSALLIAVTENNVPALKMAIKYGANVNAKDSRNGNKTGLMIAIEHKYVECFDILFARNPYLEGVDDAGRSALHFAVGVKNLDYVERLLAAGAHKEKRDSLRNTPFTWSCYHRFHEALPVLWAESIDGGVPFLREMAGGDDIEVVRFLLDKHYDRMDSVQRLLVREKAGQSTNPKMAEFFKAYEAERLINQTIHAPQEIDEALSF